MKLKRFAFTALFSAVVLNIGASRAATIALSNPSFEAPPVDPNVAPAYPFIMDWTDFPKPAFWDENTFGSWDNLTGVFPNPPTAAQGRIDNLDQNQAAYVFATAGAGFFQDSAAKFEVGNTYQVSALFTGSTSVPPVDGTTIALSLYYRNAANEMVTVGSTNIAYNATTFTDPLHMGTFTATVPAVKASDAWAGKTLGVSIQSTAAPDKSGGVWDVDRVQVSSAPALLDVPNNSFELPPVDPNVAPAYPFIVSWTDFPKPDYWDEGAFGSWDNLTGVFPNPASGQPGRIGNMDQNQAAYLFATPGAGFYQNLTAQYEAGTTYKLTIGFVGSASIPPANNTTISMALFYMNGAQMVPVASQTVTYNTQNFPDFANFVDFSATTPTTTPTSPWAGKNIGIYVVSTAGQDNSGGVWDVDHVRLTFGGPEIKLRFAIDGTNLRISWDSVEGQIYEIRGGSDITALSRIGSSPIFGTGGEVSQLIPMTGGYSFFVVRVAEID